MDSVKVDVFFSASFEDSDKDINEYFGAICKALDIRGENVSFGATKLPPDQARAMIAKSQGLIAICVPREGLTNGTFNMPQAVNDEIAFACGINIPILAIIEKGVNKGGFREKFNTYMEFERADLFNSENLHKSVKSIHEFKMAVTGEHQVGSTHEPADSHAQEMSHLVELKKGEDDFYWEYSTTKKIVYTKDSKRSFPTSVFSVQGVKVPEEAGPIHWEYEHVSSNRSLRLIPTIERQNAECVEVRLKPEPHAEENDSITYRTYCRHRYLVPLWDDEVTDDRMVHLDRGDYRIAEGLLFIHRTKKAIIEFRFCREYGLKIKDVVPFVASYTSAIDFEVESELKRANVRIEDLGGSVTIRMEVDSALPGHLYGIAWNPKSRP